jgi:DMSO/TMAO reductase YedYZ molybdopterin-dependent catalytic subunit
MRKMRSVPVAIAVVITALLAAAYLATGCTSPKKQVRLPTGGKVSVTPTDKLHVETAEGQPTIDLSTYRLSVEGLVDNKLSLSFDEIKALPAQERFVKLPCVEGWTDSATWKGPRLADLLERAGVQKKAKTVVFDSPGGYSTSLTLVDVKATDPLLAYDVNGARLPDEQGYPLRLVVPNKLGYKWIKWVVTIKLIEGDYQGYWESRGYSNSADATGR